MDNIKQLHDGGAIVGDGGAALVVVDELVHAPGPEGGPHRIGDDDAGVDVAHQLRLPLRRIRPLLQKYNLRLLQPHATNNNNNNKENKKKPIKIEQKEDQEQ